MIKLVLLISGLGLQPLVDRMESRMDSSSVEALNTSTVIWSGPKSRKAHNGWDRLNLSPDGVSPALTKKGKL